MQPEGVTRRVPVRSEARVRVSSSLARGKHPEPGIQSMPYSWPDLVDGPPPRRRTRGEGAHATYHHTEESGDIRVSYTTVVAVDPGDDLESANDDTIHVDVRVTVQRRALQELVDRERQFSDRWAARSRARLAQRLVRQRAAANQLKAKGAIAAAIWLIKLQARFGYGRIRWTRSFMRNAVEIPDRLVSRLQTASTHLGDRHGRRTIRTGLRDPALLTNEQKGVVFFLASAVLIATVLLVSNVIAFAFESAIPVYRQMVTDGAWSIASVLGLPLPSEITIVNTAVRYGPTVAFAGSFIGKIIGVWLLFFLGDSLYDTVRKATDGKPRMKRVVDWMNRNANRWGFALLVFINAVPFVPDLLLYVFAISGMRYRSYMWGAILGTALKFIAVVVAVEIIGPDQVRDFFTSPFG